MNDLVIIGTGGLAREVLQVALDCIESGMPMQVAGFVDDDPARGGDVIHGLPVLGDTEWLTSQSDLQAVIAVGTPHIKRRVALRTKNTTFATLVHPRAWVGRRVKVGQGTVLCAGAAVTTDVQIGEHVTLNLNCTVGHDALIQNYVTVAPGATISGNVTLEEGCDVGTGSAVIQGKSVGAWTIVGAGAVVVKDLARNVTAVGSPARSIKERDDGWHLQSGA